MPNGQRTASGIRRVLSDSTNFGDRSSNLSHDDLVVTMPKPAKIEQALKDVFVNLDSSESTPSLSESFYNAQALSHQENLRQSLDEFRSDTVFTTGGASFDMLSTAPPRGLIPPLLPSATIHHPTPLVTITEQKSIHTLRDSPQLTVRQKASVVSHLSKRVSAETLRVKANARRREAFSLDDLAILRIPKRLLKKWTSSNSADSISSVPKVPQPHKPIEPPPQRASTPQGLPTFNTVLAATYNLPPPPLRFRDFFRIRPSPEETDWINQTTSLPRDAVMRGADGTVVKGRWRPPQSGHHNSPASSRRTMKPSAPSGPLDAVPISAPVSTAPRVETTCEAGGATKKAGWSFYLCGKCGSMGVGSNVQMAVASTERSPF